MGLLELPQEIRDEILSYSVARPSQSMVVAAYPQVFDPLASYTLPQLCSVSKQLRAECLPLFYSNNTFKVDIYCQQAVLVFKKWLLTIGETERKSLRYLVVECDSHIDYGWELLTRIHFDLREGTARLEDHRGKGTMAQNLFRRLEDWMQGFRVNVQSREGAPFGVEELVDLMLDFRELCQEGHFRDVRTRFP